MKKRPRNLREDRKKIRKKKKKLWKSQIRMGKNERKRKNLEDQVVRAVTTRSYYLKRGKGGLSRFPR